ncbi:MAG: hypothetical protein ACKPKO_48315, partial [Candidatus Fonsibacter sp.]
STLIIMAISPTSRLSGQYEDEDDAKEATPYLTNLLHKKNYIYNNVKYQDRDGYVNTFGSHVVHRLYRLKNDNMDLHMYYNYMKTIKDEFGVNYDIIVAEFVNKWFWSIAVVRLFAPVAPSLFVSTLVLLVRPM